MLPRDLGDDAIADLNGTDEIELRTYFDQLLYLPEIDTSLQVRLPGIIAPDMDRPHTSGSGSDQAEVRRHRRPRARSQ
jgi:hypothetical protein